MLVGDETCVNLGLVIHLNLIVELLGILLAPHEGVVALKRGVQEGAKNICSLCVLKPQG